MPTSASVSSSETDSFESAISTANDMTGTPPPGSETGRSESIASTVKAPNKTHRGSRGVPADGVNVRPSTSTPFIKPNPRLPWRSNLLGPRTLNPQPKPISGRDAILTPGTTNHPRPVQAEDNTGTPTPDQVEPSIVQGSRGGLGKKAAVRFHSDSPKWHTGIPIDELRPTRSTESYRPGPVSQISPTGPREGIPRFPDTIIGQDEPGPALIFRSPRSNRPPLRPRVVTGFVKPVWIDVTPSSPSSPHSHPEQGNVSALNQPPERLPNPSGRKSDSRSADECSPLAEVTHLTVYHDIEGSFKGSDRGLDPLDACSDRRDVTKDMEVDAYGYGLRAEVSQPPQDDVQTDPRDAVATALTRKLNTLCYDVNAGFDKMANAIQGLASAVSAPVAGAHHAPSADSFQTRRRGPRLASNPVRRSTEANELAKSVREFLDQHLTGGGSLHTVTREEALGFAAAWNANGRDSLPSCTLDSFRVDLLGKPRSPWNRSAAKVFVNAFILVHALDRTPEAIDEISWCFFSRIKSMKAKSKLMLNSSAVISEHARAIRKHQRKRNLFVRRLETAQLHPRLQGHVRMLQHIGTDGMSSDESEDDSAHVQSAARLDNPRFKILEPRWRAKQLTTWLRVIDSIHLISRRSGDKSARGAYPWLRVSNDRAPEYSKNKKFVKGLPENAYDPIWFHGQHDAYVNVRPSQEPYDFNHSGELFEYLRGSN